MQAGFGRGGGGGDTLPRWFLPLRLPGARRHARRTARPGSASRGCRVRRHQHLRPHRNLVGTDAAAAGDGAGDDADSPVPDGDQQRLPSPGPARRRIRAARPSHRWPSRARNGRRSLVHRVRRDGNGVRPAVGAQGEARRGSRDRSRVARRRHGHVRRRALPGARGDTSCARSRSAYRSSSVSTAVRRSLTPLSTPTSSD